MSDVIEDDPLDIELSGHDYGGLMKDGVLYPPPRGAGGGKGGSKGGSSGGFTEDPNTVQSNSIFTAVDALCEGPVVGPYYGLQSVFLNDVPLYSISGARNFLGIVVDWRAGLPDQSHFVGMDVVEQPIVVNQRFTLGIGDSDAQTGNAPYSPFNFEVGQAEGPGVVNPDMIGVTIQLNGLSQMDTKAGKLKGNKVSYSIWCAGSDMNDYANIGSDTVAAKVTAPYQKSYSVTPVGKPPWTFQVRRETVDFTKSTEVGDTYVFSYSLIYDQKLTYMNTAAMAALVDASQFGSSLPTRSYDILGLIVDVPSNYDPYSRTYTGLWDGTFVQKWTNNPAWVCYALITTKRWGLGKKIPANMVDKWALYTVGQYCDERVPDHKGGVEPRFTFDGMINGQQDAYTVIAQVASCFRGMTYWGAQGITFTQDAPTGMRDEASGPNLAKWSSGTLDSPGTSGTAVAMASAQTFAPGHFVLSQDGNYKLNFQSDGNLVLSRVADNVVLFATATNGMSATSLVMQADGNLVIYATSTVLWASGTNGNPKAFLSLQNDGNLVIYAPTTTGTAYSMPVAIFTPANVIDGNFEYEGTAEKARHSIALVGFNDPRNNFKQAFEPVEEPELIARYGQRVIKVTAFGCCRRSQAHRYGKWILASEQLETETVTFSTGLEYADVAPGEIIGVADPMRNASAMGGRILTATSTTIAIDRTFTFDFGTTTYDIVFSNPTNEGVIRRSITAADVVGDGRRMILTTTDTADASPNDTPIQNSMFIITPAGFVDEEQAHGQMRLFRIISVKELKTHQYQIVGVEHDPTKYNRIDQDEPLVAAAGTQYTSWAVGPVRNLAVSDYIHTVMGSPVVDITISWTAPASPNPADPPGSNDPRVTSYQVMQQIDGNWTTLTVTSSPTYTATNMAEGNYTFGVRAVTPTSIGPFAVVLDHSLSVTFGIPDDVQGLSVNLSYNDATLYWQESTSTGVDKYEVLKDANTHFARENGVDQAYLHFYFTDTIPHTYGVVAGTSTNDWSVNPAEITFGPLTPPDPTGFAIESIAGNVVTFIWDHAPPLGVHYEVRAGTDWDSGVVSLSDVNAARIQFNYGSDPSAVVFWCRSKSNVGLYSLNTLATNGHIAANIYAYSAVDVVKGIRKHVAKSLTANMSVVGTVHTNTNVLVSKLADMSVVSTLTMVTSSAATFVASMAVVSTVTKALTMSNVLLGSISVVGIASRLMSLTSRRADVSVVSTAGTSFTAGSGGFDSGFDNSFDN